jgi:(p)ppGpp synthase/HD superfamily hydrolase
MIYSERIKKAMALILEAHKGQVDKGGYPYVYHPIHVAERMHSESECLIALLHDVLEDCEGYTLEGLTKTLELTDCEAEALRLITHDTSVDYMTYVEGLAKNPLALKVKLEDLRHNLDFTRMK